MPSLTKIQTGFLEPQGAFELDPGTASAPGLFFSGNTTTGMFSPSSGVLGFSTGSTQQALTILANGNVGINETTPEAKLEVDGRIRVLDNNDVVPSTGKGLEISYFNTADYADILSYDRGGSAYKDLYLRGNNLVFKTGTSERLRITSTGNVGIGTTDPGTKLEIYSSVNNFKAFSSKWTASGYYSQLELINFPENLNNLQSPQFKFVHNFGGFLTNGYIGFHRGGSLEGGFLSFGSSGYERLRISPLGNVGIGTTNPDSILTVYNASPEITFHDSNNGDRGSIDFQDGDFSIFNNTNSAGKPSVNGTTRLIVKKLGNVGIGTTNPAALLQIGSNRPVTIDGSVFINGDSGGWATQYGFIGSSGTSRGGFGGYGGADNLTYYWIGSTYSSPSMVVYPAGNIGIGTTNPTYKLHVNEGGIYSTGSGSIPLHILANSTVADPDRLIFAQQSVSNTAASILLSGRTSSATSTHTLLTSSTNGNFYISPGNYQVSATPKFTITSTGNVGIGTTNPTQKLHIYGGRLELDNALAFQTAIQFNQAGSEMAVLYRPENISNSIRMYVTGGGDVMSWTSAGNVGIGTNTPGTKLNVYGGSSIFQSSAGGSAVIIRDNSIENYNRESDTSEIAINYLGYNSTNTYFRNFTVYNGKTSTIAKFIGSTGNVGIGTTNPESKLTIAANSASAQIELKRTNSTSSGAYGAVNFTALDGHSVANIHALSSGNDDGAHLILKTTSAAGENNPYGSSTLERLRITSTGNVGIGTTNPAAKLDVSGSAIISNSNPGVGGTVLFVSDDGTSTPATGSATLRVANNGGNGAYSVFEASTGDGNFVITNDINVGINTTTPSEKLEIYGGDILLSNNAVGVNNGTGPNNQIRFEYNGHNYARIVGNGRDSSGYGDIDFYTSSGDGVTNLEQRMTIRDDGKVGIGTTEPNSALSIMTNQDYSTNGVEFDNYASLYLVNDYRGGAYTYSESVIVLAGRNSGGSTHRNSITGGGSGISFFTTLNTDLLDTPDLRIARSGNVGIGTTNPAQKLDVSGSVRLGTLSAATDFTDSGSGVTKHLTIGADSGGDALLVTHASGYGVGYFGYETGGDRLIIACDNGGGNNKIDFSVMYNLKR